MSNILTSSWNVMRKITAADTALAPATTLDMGATLPTGAVRNEGRMATSCEIVFLSSAAENKSAAFTIYAGRKGRGPARRVCTGSFTTGTACLNSDPTGANVHAEFTTLTVTPYLFADTISVTNKWIKDCYVSAEQADNQIASLAFDLWGHDWIYVEFAGLEWGSGGDMEDKTIIPLISYIG